MPLLEVPYDPAIGPVIDIEVAHLLALLRRGSVQPSVTATFIVDTGSRHSHLADHIINQLALPPCGLVPVRHRGGISTVETYPVDLGFTVSYFFRNVIVREFQQTALQYGGILGRDVLDLGAVRLDGLARRLQISFWCRRKSG